MVAILKSDKISGSEIINKRNKDYTSILVHINFTINYFFFFFLLKTLQLTNRHTSQSLIKETAKSHP